MSERTLIFAGEDEASAVSLLRKLRDRDIGGSLRSAFVFEGVEPAAKVIIMEDVPDHIAAPIKAAFPGITEHRSYVTSPEYVLPYHKSAAVLGDPSANLLADFPHDESFAIERAKDARIRELEALLAASERKTYEETPEQIRKARQKELEAFAPKRRGRPPKNKETRVLP